ncbi:hypothetical protein OKW96_18635 [Sphingobacterium sp. KU25419]|nr:hypothetical protein OKW96_18635 [Sphingobacterium sp. KU25419]
MKEALREKINELINKGIQSEAECVYLLSQLRKYREQQSIFGYCNLRMCMNWALHSSIDKGAVKDLWKDILDFLAYKEGKSDNLNFDGFEQLKNKLLFVQPLRVELLKFLDENGFDISICSDTDKYEMFLKFFARVIEDTPLVLKSESKSAQFYQVTVSKISDFDEPINING